MLEWSVNIWNKPQWQEIPCGDATDDVRAANRRKHVHVGARRHCSSVSARSTRSAATRRPRACPPASSSPGPGVCETGAPDRVPELPATAGIEAEVYDGVSIAHRPQRLRHGLRRAATRWGLLRRRGWRFHDRHCSATSGARTRCALGKKTSGRPCSGAPSHGVRCGCRWSVPSTAHPSPASRRSSRLATKSLLVTSSGPSRS